VPPAQGGTPLKPEDGGWRTKAPSAIAFAPDWPVPEALTKQEIKELVAQWVAAAQRAERVGYDLVEIHGGHGYLVHQFLSPLSNQRSDEYGGSLENRMRFPLEVFAAVRQVFDGPLGMRVSATDWVEGGWDSAQTAEFARRLKALGCNFMHVSTAGVSPLQKITIGPGYQVPYAREVRQACGLPTTAVGLITEPKQAEEILQAGDADLIAIARALLYKPRWPWEAATALGGQVQASEQYWRCLPREAQGIFGNVRIGMR